jgi:hypothetical protein
MKKNLWCKLLDFNGDMSTIENLSEENTVNQFIKSCLFSKHAMLFDGMTLVASYAHDDICKCFSLYEYNPDNKYKEIISRIRSVFVSIEKALEPV